MWYLKADDNVDLVHLLPCDLESLIEGKGDHEVDNNEEAVEDEQPWMVLDASWASADQVVTSLVYQPMYHPKPEEHCKWEELVHIKGRSEYESQQQKVKDLLLWLVHDVLACIRGMEITLDSIGLI